MTRRADAIETLEQPELLETLAELCRIEPEPIINIATVKTVASCSNPKTLPNQFGKLAAAAHAPKKL